MEEICQCEGCVKTWSKKIDGLHFCTVHYMWYIAQEYNIRSEYTTFTGMFRHYDLLKQSPPSGAIKK